MKLRVEISTDDGKRLRIDKKIINQRALINQEETTSKAIHALADDVVKRLFIKQEKNNV